MSTRRRFTGELKAKVELEALRGDKTIQEIAVRHKVHPNQVSTWKQRDFGLPYSKLAGLLCLQATLPRLWSPVQETTQQPHPRPRWVASSRWDTQQTSRLRHA